MTHDTYSDDHIRAVLTSIRSVAVIGASPKPDRASNSVTAFLVRRGLKVFAVNPGHAGTVISGAMTYASLADLPQPVDMVDVFRRSAFVSDVVDAVLEMNTLPRVLWTQLGVRDDRAAARAEAEGIIVIQNRCPAIEIPRLDL